MHGVLAGCLQVAKLQEELTAMEPKLVATQKEVEEMIVTLEADKKTAAETKVRVAVCAVAVAPCCVLAAVCPGGCAYWCGSVLCACRVRSGCAHCVQVVGCTPSAIQVHIPFRC